MSLFSFKLIYIRFNRVFLWLGIAIASALPIANFCNAQGVNQQKQVAPNTPAVATVPWQISAAKNGTDSAIKTSLADLLPELINADTVPKVLAKFTPPVKEAQVVNSDYLWLDAPQIAPTGLIKVHLLSELPGTELLLLFNAKPRENQLSLLSANIIPPLTKADLRVQIKLEETSSLLLIVRANGLWYKVGSEIKIAHKIKK